MSVFELNKNDVFESWSGHRSNLRSNLNRVSSAVDIRGSTITLRHAPTGIEIKGDVEMGHYTNKQIHTAEAQLRRQLLQELTDAVAKHLRLPGR
jgi:hypothetical protein